MLELDVMLLTLLEPSMLPRGRLRLMLMPSMELDTVWDTLVWDTLDMDTPVLGTLVSDTPVLDTMLLLDTLTSLLWFSEHRWPGPCCCPCYWRCLCWSWTLCC